MGEPAWLQDKLPSTLRWSMMIRLAWKMSLHDRQQTIAAILGVAFAYVLVGQNIASMKSFIDLNTAYIDTGEGDLWVLPPGEKSPMAPGSLISATALHQAAVTPGVDSAIPIVRGYLPVKTPDGAAENVVAFGIPGPDFDGGPFHLVKGARSDLLKPNAIFVDDADREKLGGLNLGSTIEIAGHRAHVEGLTWGLVAFSGGYAFAEYDFARSLLQIDSDRLGMVMVRLDGSVDLLRVRRELQSRVPDATVLTSDEYRVLTRHYAMFDTGLIGVVGMGVCVAVTVGLAIVTLSMLSSVQQNTREYGTLKAIGATSSDLRRLLSVQAVGYSAAGAFVGCTTLCELCWLTRGPRLNMILPPWLLVGLVPCVVGITVMAALLVVRQVSRVEPASVFR